ncbi:MAG TPA: DNA topoisomerase IV subunit A [Trebonia sp.]|nr:DNA topoisomerase IV subunit A [Trebonia sp.]
MPPRRGGRTTAPPPEEEFEENIVDIDVTEEMRGSYLEYAYSVIYSRALPDARDGLKPVQRRILFQMNEMGLRPTAAHVKCARVVGDVMGRLHPHGDTAIYDALVRLAQPWAMRLPMVDGHGNFGSLGGDDGPAAMRYTECRPTDAAMAMVESIEEDTVDFGANYDGRETEPQVLPAAIPNLLVNGTAGIAVGMATNMAPHNLAEVISAARHLLRHPDASLEKLMTFIPGPDLPTGGRIVGLDGVREAYETGRGIFKTRATTTIEQLNARKTGIVVTQLPYNVGPEKVISRIKDLVQAKKITGISDLKDLTDRAKGLNLVIEVRAGFNPEAVLAELYRLTPMEETFGINNVALVDGQPRTLGLKELLSIYIEHRLDVTRRRSEFRRRKRQDRLHLVDGILIALLNIDEVIQVIRGSDDSAAAKQRLCQVFDLSEVQAQYILDTPLRRLTRYDRLELEREQETLRAEIAELTEILENEEKLRNLVSGEMADLAKKFGTPRRTVLTEAGAAVTAAVPLEVTDDPCLVVLSATGLLARIPVTADDEPERDHGPRDPATAIPKGTGAADLAACSVATTARATIGAVTSAGRMIRVSVIEVPVSPSSAAGALPAGHPVDDFVPGLADGETVLALASLDGGDASGVALGTASGVVKRVQPDYPANRDEFELITLKEDDRVVGAAYLTGDDAELVFITSDAQLLRFSASSVRPQGRPAAGMTGVRLSDGATAIWFGAVGPAVTRSVVPTLPASPPNGRADNHEAAMAAVADLKAELNGEDPGAGGAWVATPEAAVAVVVTVAGRSGALPGAGGGSVKVTPFAEYPPKGRATGGVRCQRFLKGEDGLTHAWIGLSPVIGVTESGIVVDLTGMTGKRDGSGNAITRQLAHLGHPFGLS